MIKNQKQGLRERKKLKTRDAIISKAMEMFDEKGYEHTRIEDIADAIDISPRTFFRYFPNKEKVVFFHHEAYVEKLKKSINKKTSKDSKPYDSVKRACIELAGEYMRSKDDHIRQLRIVQSSQSLVGYAEILDTDFEDLIRNKLLDNAAGNPEKERHARIMTHVVMGIIRGTFEEWHMTGCNVDLVKLGKKIFSLIDPIL
jgi:AcrR family transcriptional regulator